VSDFYCGAFDHAVTILPDGKIAPCCVIKNGYTKDIAEIKNPNRFADLKTDSSPCYSCVELGPHSFKSFFNKFNKNKIEFIDFRNSNLCNLKCRTCGPHFSSSWAKEQGHEVVIQKINVDAYIDQILSANIREIYFAGGEPLLNADHWLLLEKLIKLGLAKNITLRYSTNLTIIDYKDRPAHEYWNHFNQVDVQVSMDATEIAFEYIRSGADWPTVDKNINTLKTLGGGKIKTSIAFTLSILSVWFLLDVLKYAKSKQLPVQIVHLTDPNYFTLNVMPDELVEECVLQLTNAMNYSPSHKATLNLAINTVRNNDDKGSFTQLISAILLADRIRNERLFDLLPFKDYAVKQIFKNQ
jgi:molybdenum cofactor biosynthesis enzyme MoaA